MRNVSWVTGALIVLTSSVLAHADPTNATNDVQENPPAATQMRSPAMAAIGVPMIVVGALTGGFGAALGAFRSANGSGGLWEGAMELGAIGGFMTLATGIALVAFGAMQVKADTWQTGLWMTPGGLTGRF